MRFKVNDKEVSVSHVGRQEMNFSQPWPAPARPVEYDLAIDLPEFLGLFAEIYQRRADEVRADEANNHKGEFPVLDRWQELGYPSLPDLAAREAHLLEELVQWFDLEALDAILPPQADSPQYVINNIDRVALDNGCLHIRGRAYPSSLAQAS